MRRGYLVCTSAHEYNDEYYSQTDGCNFQPTVYPRREIAEREAERVNIAHAYDVAGDLESWFNDGLSEWSWSDKDTPRLYKLAFPEGEAGTIEEMNKELSKRGVELHLANDDDAVFLLEIGDVKIAYVEEVEIEE